MAYPLVGIRMKDDHTLYVYDRTTFDRYDIDTLLDKDVANHLRKNPWAADPDDLAHDADDGFWTLCPDDADDLATMLSSDDKHLAAERQQGRWRVASTRRAMDGKYYTLAEFQYITETPLVFAFGTKENKTRFTAVCHLLLAGLLMPCNTVSLQSRLQSTSPGQK